jgi:8-amino-3,8-dideoxy-alpha-D-manno-octulosonate transaminase
VGTVSEKLAIDGGRPAVSAPLPPMYPGGLRIGAEEEAAVLEVLRTKRLFRYYGPDAGPSKVEELEQAFATQLHARHAVAVTSGTAALICGLAALAIGPGDEVIVPAYTWIATASAVVAVGAVPIVAEVDESLTLDPEDVVRRITPATRAIIAVHMRGAPCDMAALEAIAREHGLALLEDAAQACGGSFAGRRLGTIGDAGAFSLQFNKIITSGEGGMLVTDDDRLHQRALLYHDVAGGQRNNVPADEILPGINYRLSELQGAIALVQLQRLEDLLAAMRQRKQVLKSGITELVSEQGLRFRALRDPAGDTAIALTFFMPTADHAQRAVAALRAEGAPARRLWTPGKTDYHVYIDWTPIVNQRTWSPRGGPWRWHDGPVDYTPEQCPRTLDLLSRAVQLDISPDLTSEQVIEIANAVHKVLTALA